jgi:hypothetical protein
MLSQLSLVAQRSSFRLFPLLKGAVGDVDMKKAFLGNYTGHGHKKLTMTV